MIRWQEKKGVRQVGESFMSSGQHRVLIQAVRVLKWTVRVLVVLFWLGTMTWFAYREVWPLIFPGDAPPFVIDLADEATSQGQTYWTMKRQDREIGKAKTSLKYISSDDTFELISELKDVELTGVPFVGWVYLANARNRYVVTRDGELRSVGAEGELRLEDRRRPERHTPGTALITANASFGGNVVAGKLQRHVVLQTPLGITQRQLEPVDAPSGNILNPLHPVSRIKNLKPGRRWRMPVINPIADAVEPTLQAAYQQANQGAKPLNFKLPTSPKFIDAEVLSETGPVHWNGRDHECYIIEYRASADERPARTYVRVRDGLVLKQEAFAMGERFTLQRD
jgi:hypothetical protein